jgi:hypothetical protein
MVVVQQHRAIVLQLLFHLQRPSVMWIYWLLEAEVEEHLAMVEAEEADK